MVGSDTSLRSPSADILVIVNTRASTEIAASWVRTGGRRVVSPNQTVFYTKGGQFCRQRECRLQFIFEIPLKNGANTPPTGTSQKRVIERSPGWGTSTTCHFQMYRHCRCGVFHFFTRSRGRKASTFANVSLKIENSSVRRGCSPPWTGHSLRYFRQPPWIHTVMRHGWTRIS